MTNEKAIMCLEDMKIKVSIPKAAKQARENNEALDVAIKALQPAEPQIIRCKDCKYAEYIDDVKTLWCTECGQGRTVAPYDFCSYAEKRDDDVTCENCDYSEKYVDGLILCRRTKTSHRVYATSTCGKGKREAKDELQKTSDDE